MPSPNGPCVPRGLLHPPLIANLLVADYPKIAQLKTVAAFRARLAELGLELPVDDAILTAAAGLAAGPADRHRAAAGRQPLVHSSDGRLGRQSRRLAERADAAALAEFRHRAGRS